MGTITARVEALLFAVVFGTALFATGCPEPGPQNCSSDGDCGPSEACVDGTCQTVVDPGEDADADVGEDADDADADAGNVCREYMGSCVRRVCDAGDTCQNVTCTIECEPWEELNGCDCERRTCSDVEDCFGYACVDGECQRCKSDDQCGSDRKCYPSRAKGKCLTGKPCTEDTDCPVRKECSSEDQCVDRPSCVDGDDCDSDEICFNGRCTYSTSCENDSECRGELECVGGQCYEAVCRGPDDCPDDKVCSAGECQSPPEATRCFVATPDQQITQGESIQLQAFAVDQNGQGVAASFEWSSSDASVAKIDSSGQRAVGGSSSGTATVAAKISGNVGVKCQGEVKLSNLGSVASGKVRVSVSSTENSAPVSGATVVLSSSASGTTNSSGVVTLNKPSGSYTVSVFHPDHNYLTVRGLQTNDVRLPLREKEGSGEVAGFTGSFDKSKLHTSGDVTLGLAGSSITGGLLEVGLDQLLGRPVVREVQTPQGKRDVPLPSGLVFNGTVFGFNLNVKKKYFTTSSGGARIGWGLAGEVPGRQLVSLFQGGLDNPIAALLPLFNRFDHAARPLQLSAMPRVQDKMDFDGDGDTTETIPDYQNFPAVDLQPSVRQNLVTAVSLANFPTLPNGSPDFAVLVGGNLQSGTGLVPLGISATTDDDEDGKPDVQNLSVAPPHGSVTGGDFAVMALSFRADALNPQGGLELPDNFSAALWTNRNLSKQIGLGTFPDATTGSIDTNARTVQLTADAGPLFRFQFVGSDRTWEMWTTGPAASQGSYQHTAQIPSVPSGQTDLFVNNTKVLVDAVETGVAINRLAKAGGIGLRRVGRRASAFNRTGLK